MSNTELLSSCDELSLYPLDIPTVALHFTGWAATTHCGPREGWHVLRASVSPSSTASENPCQHSSSAGWSSQPLPCLVMEKNNQEGCVAFLNSRPDPKHSRVSEKRHSRACASLKPAQAQKECTEKGGKPFSGFSEQVEKLQLFLVLVTCDLSI